LKKQKLGVILKITPFLLILYLQSFFTNSLCIFQISIGLPCPGCGTFRSCVALLQGNIKQSLSYHPLLGLTLLIVGYFFLKYFCEVELIPKHVENRLSVFFMIIYILVFVIRLCKYFPNIEPMVPFQHSLWYLLYSKITF